MYGCVYVTRATEWSECGCGRDGVNALKNKVDEGGKVKKGQRRVSASRRE
jgi:hypothetical protein